MSLARNFFESCTGGGEAFTYSVAVHQLVLKLADNGNYMRMYHCNIGGISGDFNFLH